MEIVIAHGRRLVCDSVEIAVSALPDARVLGQATTLDGALARARRASGQAVLVAGTRLEDGDLLDLIRRAGAGHAVVALTRQGELNMAREALRMGAAGICLEDELHASLVPTLQAVEGGVVALSRPLMVRILDKEADRLTRREHEIMGLLAEGLTNFQISARLGLSQNTVKYYLKTIYQKLEVTSRGAAIARYISAQY